MSVGIIATYIIVFAFAGVVVADDPNELNYIPGDLL